MRKKQNEKARSWVSNLRMTLDDDIQEASKTWELNKQLSLYVEMEDEVLRNLTNFRRSFRKRTTLKHYK